MKKHFLFFDLTKKDFFFSFLNLKLFFLMVVAAVINIPLCSLGAGTETTTNTQANINQGAKKGSQSQNMGTVINLAAAGSLGAICATESGAWACPMAAMSLIQAATQAAASRQSNGVYDTTQIKTPDFSNIDLGGDKNNFPPTPGGNDGRGGFETGFSHANIDGQLKKLEQMGYKVNLEKGTVKTPKGEYPMSAFGSPAAMAAAGMDGHQVAAAQAGLEALNKELKEKYGNAPSVVPMGVSSLGGGGASFGGPPAEPSSDSDPMAAYLASLKSKLNEKRSPSSVAGMQKMLGGEPIGVKMDNIFDMVHRRYQLKRKANLFIE